MSTFEGIPTAICGSTLESTLGTICEDSCFVLQV